MTARYKWTWLDSIRMQNFGGLQAIILRYELELPNWKHLSYVKPS